MTTMTPPMSLELAVALHAVDVAITRLYTVTLRAGMPAAAIEEARGLWMAWGETLEWQEEDDR